MSSETTTPGSAVAERFVAFLAERFPFALEIARASFAAAGGAGATTSEAIESVRTRLGAELRMRLRHQLPDDVDETTPGTSGPTRFAQAVEELVLACDGALRRAAIRASLTPDERREILRGMLLTRATDNRLKTFFTGGEVRYGDGSFQGKGFRSLGQEAIYAAGIRLRRGPEFQTAGQPESQTPGQWTGDVVAPLIRDLGVALAMKPDGETVRMVLSAQMAKAGPPMNGKDLHIGDFASGILPAAAPLAISTLTAAGMAMAFARDGSGRVALSFIGEGGSSLGEWHEAINLCAARRLPAVFCVQNNQTALSTPVAEQSAVRVFADKAQGYGIPGITIDGTDPDEIAAAFAWAVERARAGDGPALIELVCMRMCGHAHHDDMLYLGKEPQASWEYRRLTEQGYANPGLYAFWSARDPLKRYAARLEAEGILGAGEADEIKREVEALVEREARAVIEAPWPEPSEVGAGRLCRRAAARPGRAARPGGAGVIDYDPGLPPVEERAGVRPQGTNLPRGRDARRRRRAARRLRACSSTARTSAASTATRSCCSVRCSPSSATAILNSPLAEGAVLGVCVGAALAGQRPIGEMQFNDFVATGFNQLVNNAAKIRYRWGGSVPMVVRMPWGGLRHAGPYHSQNTEPWFYRTPGLKIVVPSTPADARALMASAVADPDPGAVLRAHRALSRSADQAGARRRGAGAAADRPRRAATRRRRPRDRSPTAPTSTWRCASPTAWPPTASKRRCSTCARSRRSIATRSCASPATAAAS